MGWMEDCMGRCMASTAPNAPDFESSERSLRLHGLTLPTAHSKPSSIGSYVSITRCRIFMFAFLAERVCSWKNRAIGISEGGGRREEFLYGVPFSALIVLDVN